MRQIITNTKTMTDIENTQKVQEIQTASINVHAFAKKYTEAISEAIREDNPQKYATALGYLERMGNEMAKLKWRVADKLN